MFDHSHESKDDPFLRRALALAREGIALASPNPVVGAVLADANGHIVGEGSYTYAGKTHAEILALAQAGEKSGGSTLYINLEPHAHQGRTPPCTDALIAGGVRRVVAAMADPNPKVSGRGFQQLRAAGIQVDVGLLETEARFLNEAFARYIRRGVPLVTLKSAMTLDGKIAPAPGAANHRTPGTPAGGWITGEAARAHVHQQRHQSDAILVGVGTILADDPLLTDRSRGERRRPLLRVILDSNLRLPLDSRIVNSATKHPAGDVLIFCSSPASQKQNELEARGIRIEPIAAATDGRLDLHAVLRRLGELEVTSLMIEGGSTTNGAALAAGVVDKVFLYYAPKISTSDEAIPFASGASLGSYGEALPVKHPTLHRFGEDFALEGYLRDPYAD